MIFSSAAGVDHITCDPDLPRGVPIVRMATEETAQSMGEYVCLAALSILRDGNWLAAAQANRRWDPSSSRTRRSTSGSASWGWATSGRSRRACCAAWASRSQAGRARRASSDGIKVHSSLDSLLAESDILVGLLPGDAADRAAS